MNENNTNEGIGFLGLLTIAFITLKLTGFIDWSWWMVLSPMLIVPVLILIFIIIVLILGLFS